MFNDFSEKAPWNIRDGLTGSREKFDTTDFGRVAFIGGSITANHGWRDHVCEYLKKFFPKVQFDFINAGIGGTNSTFGAARLEEHVFSKGQVDLLFLEYAVNDDSDLTADNRANLAFEGIIRHARRLNPEIEIVVLYFASISMIETIKAGGVPRIIDLHESIARHYNISSVNLAQAVTSRLQAGEFTWDQFSNDTCHPLAFGSEIYANVICDFLTRVWEDSRGAEQAVVCPMLPSPLFVHNYEYGRLVTAEVDIISGWRHVKQWTAEKTCNYTGAVDVFAAEVPDAAVEFAFKGTTVAFYAIAGMDAGILECFVDGKPCGTVDMFDQYGHLFHRPVFRVLAEMLEPGEHILKLIVSRSKNPQSCGHAVRILRFAVFDWEQFKKNEQNFGQVEIMAGHKRGMA